MNNKNMKKKLSLEEGHLVLRNLDGTLCWSRPPVGSLHPICRRTRKQVRADRLWRHWLSWMGEPYGPDFKRIEGYQPEKYRSAFERFQTHGRKGLSEDELYGIHPLLSAQKAKEVTLTSMAEESMEWWSKGNGWAIPWLDTLEKVKSGEKMDRLTRVAILRTVKTIAKDPHDFFERHPGISAELKQRYFSYRVR